MVIFSKAVLQRTFVRFSDGGLRKSISASNKIYLFLGNNFVGKLFHCFPLHQYSFLLRNIFSLTESHTFNKLCMIKKKSHLDLKTNHQRADSLNIWLHISPEITTVLNLNHC